MESLMKGKVPFFWGGGGGRDQRNLLHSAMIANEVVDEARRKEGND